MDFYTVARAARLTKFYKYAAKRGQFPSLDKFIDKEFDQVDGLKGDAEFVAWAHKELYKQFDRGFSSDVKYVELVNDAFKSLVENNIDKKLANAQAYEQLFQTYHPAEFFKEGHNLHIALGQVFYWSNKSGVKLTHSSNVAWTDAVSTSNKFIKTEVKKGKGEEAGVSLDAKESVDKLIVYLSKNNKVPNSDLSIEIIAVPKGLPKEQVDQIEQRCKREGSEGEHCLYTNYWKTIRSGQAIALSFRTSKGGFVATARIDIDDLVELKGVENAPPPDQYKTPILNWVMGMVDSGMLNRISGLADLGNLMSEELVTDAFSFGNVDMQAAAIISGKADSNQVSNAYAANPDNLKLIKAIAGSPSTEAGLLIDIAKRFPKDQGVLTAFAMNPEYLPEELWKFLLNHPNKQIRYALLSGNNRNDYSDKVSKEDLVEMGKHDGGKFNGRYLAYVLANNKTPPELVDDILSNPNIPNSVTAAVITNPRASSEIKQKVFFSMSDEERLGLPGNELYELVDNMSSENMNTLATSRSKTLRLLVARDRRALPKTLALLSNDDDLDVVASVAKNPNTPLKTLHLLAKDRNPYIHNAVLDNTNTAPQTLAMFVKDEKLFVRRMVASHSNTASETLATLADDTDEEVRIEVAKNSNTSPNTLSLLAADTNMHVRMAVAKNPNTPPDTLSFLAAGKGPNDPLIRLHVGENPNTPPKTRALIQSQSGVDSGSVPLRARAARHLYKLATESNAAYLQGINLSELRKTNPKRDDQPDAEYYKGLRELSKNGPIFSNQTLELISNFKEEYLPTSPKPFIKWLANQLENNKEKTLKELSEFKNSTYGGIKDFINATGLKNYKDLEELKSKSVEWHNQFTVNENTVITGDPVVYKFDTGFTIVKVLPENLGKEGEAMGHCVGGYCERVESGKEVIYSLRDPNGQPHATISVRNNKIDEIKGKQNDPPIEKYRKYIKEWLKSTELNYKSPEYISIADEEELGELAKDEAAYVRATVAQNQTIPVEILYLLSTDEFSGVRYYVAKNSKTPTELLSLLAKDKEFDVRQQVAGNSNTSIETLSLLAKDEDSVRMAVARNPKTPDELLYLLAKDRSTYVRKYLATNPSIPLGILTLLADDKSSDVLEFVADNFRTPPDILSLLATDEYYFVRKNVANNPNTPIETVSLLTKDESESVRSSALYSLKLRSNNSSIQARAIRYLYKQASVSKATLQSLRPDFAAAAQSEYDQWDQSGEYGDPTLGFGGICQDIAGAMADVIYNKTDFEASTVSAAIGEQHVFVIVQTPDGVYEVDIPPHIYESGGGYNWQKLPDVKFEPADIIISLIDGDPESFDNYLDS